MNVKGNIVDTQNQVSAKKKFLTPKYDLRHDLQNHGTRESCDITNENFNKEK